MGWVKGFLGQGVCLTLGMPFTIYATLFSQVTVDGRTYLCETWIVDDHFYLATLECMEALGSMLSRENLEELGLTGSLKHPEAEFVAVVKRSVDLFATKDDIENIVKHETCHHHLGHKTSSKEAEEECDRLLGFEDSEALHMFGLRYMAYVLRNVNLGFEAQYVYGRLNPLG